MKVVARIETEQRWGELLAATEIRVNAALVEWGNVVLGRIREYETRVGTASPTRAVSPGVHLRDTFRVSAVFKGISGFMSGNSMSLIVYTPDPNAIWQESGTRGRRRKKLKQPDRGKVSRGPGTGVRPLHFMKHAVKDSYVDGVELVQRSLE